MPEVLDPAEKKIIFEALKKVEKAKLCIALIKAALNGEVFPIECKEFSDLCSLHSQIEIEAIKPDLNGAICKYIDLKILTMFQALLMNPFEPMKWQSNFLLFLANDLNINVNSSSLVQLCIQEGKILWRITNGDTVLYDRCAHKTSAILFNFAKNPHISLTWEQFRLFKDSGKRAGSIAITQELFIKEFPPRQQQKAADVWVQLKEKGILDHNNRLSSIWHFASSSYLYLDRESIPYPDICNAFKKIITNPDNAEKIACIPNASLYRPNRSFKEWAKTRRIKGLEPTSEAYRVKLWDVSVYQNLNNHAVDNDGLDHDHIPSVTYLKAYKQSYINGFSTQGLPLEQLNWIAEAKLETNQNWSCIAIPHRLHTQSLSFGEAAITQQKDIKAPFLDEVRTYLNILEQQTEQKLSDNDEYLRSLGAFRYMYRCQVKGKHGKVPQMFFHNTNKDEIDKLFLERLEKFTLQG